MASRSNISNAAATQSQRKVVTDNKRTNSNPPTASKLLGLASASTDSFKVDGKRQLFHTDSGYISPTVAPTSNGNSPQTPSESSRGLHANFQIGGTSAQTSSEDLSKRATENDPSSESLVIVPDSGDIQADLNRSADIRNNNMQSLLPRESHTSSPYGPRSIPDEAVSVSVTCMYVANSFWCQFAKKDTL